MSILHNTPRATVVRVLGALLVAGALAVLTGCAVKGTADRAKGRVLFQQKCGVCHTLAEAGTGAQVGPNLDYAFAQARAQGMDQDTIQGVVKAQVEDPRPSNPDDIKTYMPRDVVSGQDLEDVAAYVTQDITNKK